MNEPTQLGPMDLDRVRGGFLVEYLVYRAVRPRGGANEQRSAQRSQSRRVLFGNAWTPPGPENTTTQIPVIR